MNCYPINGRLVWPSRENLTSYARIARGERKKFISHLTTTNYCALYIILLYIFEIRYEEKNIQALRKRGKWWVWSLVCVYKMWRKKYSGLCLEFLLLPFFFYSAFTTHARIFFFWLFDKRCMSLISREYSASLCLAKHSKFSSISSFTWTEDEDEFLVKRIPTANQYSLITRNNCW